jgi:hypothetical protein
MCNNCDTDIFALQVKDSTNAFRRVFGKDMLQTQRDSSIGGGLRKMRKSRPNWYQQGAKIRAAMIQATPAMLEAKKMINQTQTSLLKMRNAFAPH